MKILFIVLTEDFKMALTDEVHRIKENVYKVSFYNYKKFDATGY